MQSILSICGENCPDWPYFDTPLPERHWLAPEEFEGSKADWLHLLYCGFRRTFARRRLIPADRADPSGLTFCDLCRGREGAFAQCSEDLARGAFSRGCVQIVRKPKRTGGTRPISIPTYADRVLARGLLALLRPLESTLCPGCVGGVSHSRIPDILNEVQVAVANGKAYAVSCDIRTFYDSIPHAPLSQCLERTLPAATCEAVSRLVECSDSPSGILQGMPLSTMVGNFYLSPVDGVFYRREVEYWRYIDDILVLAASRRAAHRHLGTLENALEAVGLGWKEAPVVRKITTSQGVAWLGVEIRADGRRIPSDRLTLIERRLRHLRRPSEGYSPHRDRLAQRLRGVLSYYVTCRAAPAERLLQQVDRVT